ncbi:MAG: hypothetical protein ACOYJ8_02930 [Patescibacteria group bacterium]|jgi:hypothetical protein
MINKERFVLGNQESQSVTSPLVSEIIKNSSLHPNSEKDSSTKKRLKDKGILFPLLSAWEQSLQQFDDRLTNLVENEKVRYNYHTIPEIEKIINKSFAQEENQKSQDEILSPAESFTQFVNNQENLSNRTKGVLLRCFKDSAKKLIGAHAGGAEKSLKEIKNKKRPDWGRARGGDTGQHSKRRAGTYRSY